VPGFLERFASKKDTSYDHAQVKVVPVRLLLDRISLVYSVRVVNSSFTFLGVGGGGRGAGGGSHSISRMVFGPLATELDPCRRSLTQSQPYREK